MGLGKTITVVSLMANTIESARAFVGTIPLKAPPPVKAPPPPRKEEPLTAAHFAGTVWGLPPIDDITSPIASSSSASFSAPVPAIANLSMKAKAKNKAAEMRSAEEQARQARIKTKSRATLIVCPLSTVVNWEDQFKEHWAGEVIVVGGATGLPVAPTTSTSVSGSATPSSADMRGGWAGALMGSLARGFPTTGQVAASAPAPKTNALRVYVYHGTSRRPDPNFLADFDAVITTYSTLASEFSKQSKSAASAVAASVANGHGPPLKLSGGMRKDEYEEDFYDEDDTASSSDGITEVDQFGKEKEKKKKKTLKRKKAAVTSSSASTHQHFNEVASPLQMVHWFRVVLDEAQ